MDKTLEQMIRELYTVILGAGDKEQGGMAEQVKSIEEHLKELNGAVKTNTTWRKALCWVVGVMATGVITLVAYVMSHL